MPDLTVEMDKMHSKLSQARNFEEVNKLKTVEKDNLRMLGKFLEIQRGRQLSVPKANYIENIQEISTSPVHEFHSVRVLNKLSESK